MIYSFTSYLQFLLKLFRAFLDWPNMLTRLFVIFFRFNTQFIAYKNVCLFTKNFKYAEREAGKCFLLVFIFILCRLNA